MTAAVVDVAEVLSNAKRKNVGVLLILKHAINRILKEDRGN